MTYMAFHSYSSIKSKDHIPTDPAPACLNPAPGRRYWKIAFSSTRGASYNTGIVRFSMTQSLPLICAIFPATHTRYAKKSSSCFLHTFHNLCDVGSMRKTGGIMRLLKKNASVNWAAALSQLLFYKTGVLFTTLENRYTKRFSPRQ